MGRQGRDLETEVQHLCSLCEKPQTADHTWKALKGERSLPTSGAALAVQQKWCMKPEHSPVGSYIAALAVR